LAPYQHCFDCENKSSRLVNVQQDYSVSKIPKGRGRYRFIYIPSKKWASHLRSFLPDLDSRLLELDEAQVNYGFVRDRNCVLNAFQHIGFEYSISFDLEDFFDSVSSKHLKGLLEQDIIEQCLIDGVPRQGLPTSPVICNIAFSKCDTSILKVLETLNVHYVYTRYADDLTISLNDPSVIPKIKALVSSVVASYGFKINRSKTKVQSIKNGRIIITGIGIDSEVIHPTRKTLKKIRAAIHQDNKSSLKGLSEWSKCKFPKRYIGKL